MVKMTSLMDEANVVKVTGLVVHANVVNKFGG